jgi:cytochrome c oxidase subunit 3/cytochrome o ubiquinol oxidase subunit 3
VPDWRRVDPNVVGVGIFITSEAVFFLSLIIVYVVYHGRTVSGPSPREVLDIPYAAVITVLLLSSSFTITRAGARLGRDDRRGALLWLLATIALGAAFLIGQGIEYTRLVAENVTPARNLFGTMFYTLTGFHGVHVSVGIIFLMSLFVMSLRGKITQENAETVEIFGLYWHFVDIVWILIFTVVYLIP